MKNCHIVVANGLGRYGSSIKTILENEGYRNVSYVAGGSDVLSLCNHMRVDLVLLDLAMPDMEGADVIARLGPSMRRGRLQVIVVTDTLDSNDRYRVLSLGARDFITEPIDPPDVQLRVRNALMTSKLEAELIDKNAQLAEAIDDGSEQLHRTRKAILRHLAIAAEFRDDDTGEHTDRVGRTAAAIANAHGQPPEQVRLLAAAAPLHDIGKIGIPDSILLKPGRLNQRERALMKTHTQIGAVILSNSEVPEIRLAEKIALSHHEHWDGGGYPHGIAGVSIPFEARIVAIADVFDALTFERPYKRAWSIDAALEEIQSQRGRQFDAQLVDAFMRLNHEQLRSPIRSNGTTSRRREVFEAAAAALGAAAVATSGGAPGAHLWPSAHELLKQARVA